MPSTNQILTSWSKKVGKCTACDISKLCDHKVAHYLHRNEPIDVAFIGEAPGQSEYNAIEPFVGPAGDCLREIVAEALPPELNYCFLNTINCTPFTNESRADIRVPTKPEIANCSLLLSEVLARLKPTKVVSVGAIAEKTLKKMKLDYVRILHTSKINQAGKRYAYEFAKAVQLIRNHVCT